jgi:hypothetical protein
MQLSLYKARPGSQHLKKTPFCKLNPDHEQGLEWNVRADAANESEGSVRV